MPTATRTRSALKAALAEFFSDYDLHLEAIGWKENVVKETVEVTVKVSGSSNEQVDLPFDDGEGRV